ncbi:MAG: hypothetical protein HY077_12790 [Elusimicrobia bacterium]|nr:hypothetical protein [Elusimicrobiota bacterium]
MSVGTDELGALLGRLESLKEAGGSPVAVFDLDDTLLSTDRRHLRILHEFTAQPSVRLGHPEAVSRLGRIGEGALRYSMTDTARAAGINDEGLLAALKEFWSARFFTNDYLLADHPVLGAPQFCRDASARGATLVYFTGRDETMREGTAANLARWGFPEPGNPSVHLILKPRFDLPDLEYKREGLRRIANLGPVAASFENEPAHLNLFHEAFPEAWLYLLETKHSGRPVEAHPASRRIRDFRRA